MAGELTPETAKFLWHKWKQENPQWMIERNRKIGVFTRKRDLLNNPMKNPKIAKKVHMTASKTLKRMYKEGKWLPGWKNPEVVKKALEKRKKLINEGKIITYFQKHPETGVKAGLKTRIKKGQHLSVKTEIKKGQFSGDKHFNWRGGVSFNPYSPEFNEQLKDMIRKRDNYTCQLCGLIQDRQKLDIHHIDYNKKNNIIDNLISLCRSCNDKANFNKEYWKELFINKLKEVNKLWQRKEDLEIITLCPTNI